MTTIIAVFVVLLAVFIIIWATDNDKDQKKIERLKQEYEMSLLGSDRKAALTAGRLYYAACRKNNTPSLYDEQAITNDLCTMPQEIYLMKGSNNDLLAEQILTPSRSTIINQ